MFQSLKFKVIVTLLLVEKYNLQEQFLLIGVSWDMAQSFWKLLLSSLDLSLMIEKINPEIIGII